MSRASDRSIVFFLSTFISLMISGCGQLMPPSIPSGQTLLSYDLTDYAPYSSSGTRTPKDRVIIGLSYVDQQCSGFFDAVEQSHRYVALGKSTLLTSGTQAASLMAIAKKSAINIASVAAAVEITKVLLEQYEREFTFAPHSVELRALIQASMNAQGGQIGALLVSNSSLSDIEAIALVKKYASNCTLAAIHEAWNRAIGKAVQGGVVAEVPKAPAPPPPPAPPVPASESRRLGSNDFGSNGGVLSINKFVVR